MAGNIKGITIKIGADTTELTTALRGVNKTIRTTESELKAINNSLKFNPNSTELLKQKQEALADAVAQTSNKLDQLKKAQVQAKEQLEKGEIGKDKYNALEREILKTTNQLERFTAQSILAGNTSGSAAAKIAYSFDKASTVLKKTGTALTELSAKLRGVSMAAAAALVASVKYASDTEEATNKVEVAFGDSTESVEKFAETTLKSYGLAKGTALDMAALFGDMGTSMGLTQEEAAQMSTTLVGLSGDLASFKNIGVDQASNALKGIFTGETESLKTLGIVMTETQLSAYALANGYTKTYKEMSQSEKVALRFAFVMDATKNAQGDFARTGDATANSLRVAQESLKELAATMGEQLLPIAAKAAQKVSELVQKFANMDKGTKKALVSIIGLLALASPILGAIGKIANGLSIITKGLSNLAIKAVTGASKLGGLVNTLGGLSNILKVVSPIALYTGALLGISKAAIEVSKALGLEVNDLSVHNKYLAEAKGRVEDYLQSQKELAEASSEQYLASQGEITRVQALKDRLNELVDSNGKVKAGYEDTAAVLVGQLQDATGVQINLNNGLISSWNEVNKAIDENIEKMKAQAIIDAYSDDYADAIQNITQAENDLAIATAAYKREYDSLIAQGMNGTDADFYARQRSGIEEATAAWQGYNQTIQFVQGEQEAFAQGHYAQMETDLRNYVNGVYNLQNLDTTQLEEALAYQEDLRDGYEEQFRRTGDAHFKELSNQSANQVAELRSQISRMRGVAGGALKVGEDIINGIQNGLNNKKSGLFGAITSIGDDMIAKFKAKMQIHSPSRVFKQLGLYTMQGLEQGLDTGASGVIASLSTLSDDMTGFSSSLSYAVARPATETQVQAGADSSAFMQTLVVGLAQLGLTLSDAMPKAVNVNLDGQTIASASWGHFENEGQKRGRMFAPSQNEISIV